MTREDMIGELTADAERVQYSGLDETRIEYAATGFTRHAVELIASMGEYGKELVAETDEDSVSRMGYARRDLIEKWALVQAALSKLAYVSHFSGDEAYTRVIDALKTEGPIDMQGL